MLKVARLETTALGIVIQVGQRCQDHLLDSLHAIEPEEGFHVVAHRVGLAAQVAAFFLHQKQYRTAGIVHLFGISRIVKVLMTLKVYHALMTAGDDRAIEIVHHTADGIGNMPVGIVLITQHHLLTYRIAIGPIALGKTLAHHHLVGCLQHLMLVASQQLVVEELKEIGCHHQDFGLNLHATDIEGGIITRDRAPALDFRETVLQFLSHTEVRHSELLVANGKDALATGLVVLY